MKNNHTKTNIEFVTRSGLCMGCGVCKAVCPVNAIRIPINSQKGFYVPVVNHELCTDCRLCVDICPGHSVNFEQLWEKDTRHFDAVTGPVDRVYFGHSCDEDIRYHSSSGGIITSLLIHALENGMIQGALVTRMDLQNPTRSQSYIATTPDDILNARGSKYCPTSIDQALMELLHSDGKFAVVGLPCHLHAIRKLQSKQKKVRDKIKFLFGLFCANNNTFHAMDYFLGKNKIGPNKIEKINYRDNGWPGQLTIKMKNGETHVFKRGTTEKSLQKKILFSSSFHYDFQIPRCLLCPDLTAELADISFADPWNKQFLDKERTGISMVLVRNEPGKRLIDSAINNNIISLYDTTFDMVTKSQNSGFKMSAGTRIAFRKLTGKPVPLFTGKRFKKEFTHVLKFLYLTPYFTTNKLSRKFLPIIAYSRFFTLKILNKLF